MKKYKDNEAACLVDGANLKDEQLRSSMEWQELKPSNLPDQGSWILISNGKDWRRVFVTPQFEFVEKPDDRVVYSQGITHWCEVKLP